MALKCTRRLYIKFQAILTPFGPKSKSCSKVSSPGGDSIEDIKSSIRAYGWSQNTSKKLYVKFQVKPTTFDHTSTLKQQNQTSQRREPLRPSLIIQSTWVASKCFQRATRQASGHFNNIWPNFDPWKQNQTSRRWTSPGP